MTSPRFVIGAVVIAAGAGAMSGCSAPPEPEPTPSPMFSSEEEAFAAAEEVYRAYLQAADRVQFDAPETFAGVLQFTTGTMASSERESLSLANAEGFEQRGETHLVYFHPIAEDPELSQLFARACIDLRETAILDSMGNSLVSPTRGDTLALDLTFEQRSSRLLIAQAEAVEDPSCVID